MAKNEAIVEILLAAYNGESFIREQLDSIVNQSDTRWHLTVSDDGSTDGTPRLLDEYVQRYPEKITRYFSGQRFGNARDHFFCLMRQCDAAYMMFCDQDDVWYPDKVQEIMAAMLAAENQYGIQTPLLVFTDQTPTDAQLRPLAPSLMRYQKQYFKSFEYRSILMQNVVTGGAMAINRALALLGAQCVDTQNVIMHDWWLAVVAARFGRIIYLDEPMSDYRQHAGNSVGAKNVGGLFYMLFKLRHLQSLKETISEKKRQADVFKRTYAQGLSDEDQLFLCQMAKKRSGIGFYCQNRAYVHGFFRLVGMMMLG